MSATSAPVRRPNNRSIEAEVRATSGMLTLASSGLRGRCDNKAHQFGSEAAGACRRDHVCKTAWSKSCALQARSGTRPRSSSAASSSAGTLIATIGFDVRLELAPASVLQSSCNVDRGPTLLAAAARHQISARGKGSCLAASLARGWKSQVRSHERLEPLVRDCQRLPHQLVVAALDLLQQRPRQRHPRSRALSTTRFALRSNCCIRRAQSSPSIFANASNSRKWWMLHIACSTPPP